MVNRFIIESHQATINTERPEKDQYLVVGSRNFPNCINDYERYNVYSIE